MYVIWRSNPRGEFS